MAAIEAAIKKLEKKHHEHISVYGEDNEQRLIGSHETASMTSFSAGVADRGASVSCSFRVIYADGKLRTVGPDP